MPLEELIPRFSAQALVPLVYALVLGGAVGLERELNGRAAGLRTHVLVCLSATMVIALSRTAAAEGLAVGRGPRLVMDPNRMGAGIVTGIGFLGAATVMRSGDLLRGLTTAACIWFVAGLGIALGSHEYGLGVAATAFVLFVLVVMKSIERLLPKVVYRRLIVLTPRTDLRALMNEVRAVLKQHGLRVLDVASGYDATEGRGELVFYVSFQNRLQNVALTEEVTALSGVQVARWKLIDVPR